MTGDQPTFDLTDFDSLLAVDSLPIPEEESAYFFLPLVFRQPGRYAAALAPPSQVRRMCETPNTVLLLGFLRDDGTRRCLESIWRSGVDFDGGGQLAFPLCVVIGGMYWVAMRLPVASWPQPRLCRKSEEYGLILQPGPPRLMPNGSGGTEHSLQVGCPSHVLWRKGLPDVSTGR